jgi:hypothetical protein
MDAQPPDPGGSHRRLNNAQWTVTSGGSYCALSTDDAGNPCVQDTGGDYGANEDCSFTLETGGATLVRMEWGLEGGETCAYDYLQVAGGTKYCGATSSAKALPASMAVSGATAFAFHSDDTASGAGFKICAQPPSGEVTQEVSMTNPCHRANELSKTILMRYASSTLPEIQSTLLAAPSVCSEAWELAQANSVQFAELAIDLNPSASEEIALADLSRAYGITSPAPPTPPPSRRRRTFYDSSRRRRASYSNGASATTAIKSGRLCWLVPFVATYLSLFFL